MEFFNVECEVMLSDWKARCDALCARGVMAESRGKDKKAARLYKKAQKIANRNGVVLIIK